MANKPEPIYLNLSADDPDLGTTEIESMCMNCQENVRNLHPEHSTQVGQQHQRSMAHVCFVSGNHEIVVD